MQPLLRWAGSKKRQYPKYKLQFPRIFSRYLEPFAGSAAFSFLHLPRTSLLNDINSDIIDFYDVARSNPEDFYREFVSIKRDKNAYYECRNAFNISTDKSDRAVLFYYLNRNCFNGIYRVNKSGQFNVPYASERVAPYPDQEAFCRAAAHLNSCQLYNCDFMEFCTKSVRQDDFVFLDPPYYVSGKRIFREYNTQEFLMGDFDRLAALLDTIDRTGAFFLLSYPTSEEVTSIAKRWYSTKTEVLRTIAARYLDRRTQSETLISNFRP